jgi:hypothetical protein
VRIWVGLKRIRLRQCQQGWDCSRKCKTNQYESAKPRGFTMTMREKELEWLCHRTEEHLLKESYVGGLVENLGEVGKLGQGFSSIDAL